MKSSLLGAGLPLNCLAITIVSFEVHFYSQGGQGLEGSYRKYRNPHYFTLCDLREVPDSEGKDYRYKNELFIS